MSDREFEYRPHTLTVHRLGKIYVLKGESSKDADHEAHIQAIIDWMNALVRTWTQTEADFLMEACEAHVDGLADDAPRCDQVVRIPLRLALMD